MKEKTRSQNPGNVQKRGEYVSFHFFSIENLKAQFMAKSFKVSRVSLCYSRDNADKISDKEWITNQLKMSFSPIKAQLWVNLQMLIHYIVTWHHLLLYKISASQVNTEWLKLGLQDLNTHIMRVKLNMCVKKQIFLSRSFQRMFTKLARKITEAAFSGRLVC